MLAGWAHLKFPHLIHAAVSSSAPVRAELDMRGYNDVVSEAYAVMDEGVGGSPACRAAIAKGHEEIGKMFGTSVGNAALASLFGQEPEWYSLLDHQRSFAGQGVAVFPAQSNDPLCGEPMCNIRRICAAMTNASLGDEVHRLAHVRGAQLAARQLQARPPAEETPEAAPGYEQANLWGWQTCTEFGFYQTCEAGSGCFYTQGLADLTSEMSFCEEVFGISRAAVEANIIYSNAYYGADSPQGVRVLYVNGEVDPWHANSIIANLSAELPAIYVAGASHHAWTHPSTPSDQASVREARAKIRARVRLFLAEGKPKEAAAQAVHSSALVV
jgi:serine protease 16